MGTILKVGRGVFESRFNIFGKDYKDAEIFDLKNYKIEVKKTKNFPVNGNTFRDHWRFDYFDRKDILKSYITGEPEKNNVFFLHRIQSSKIPEMSNSLKLFYFAYHSFMKKIDKNHLNPYKQMNNERGLLLTWNFLKDYLKEEGFEKIVTMANYRFYDTLSIDFKVGWKDLDKKRKLERFVSSIPERNKRLKFSERVAGLVRLEYFLNEEE